MLPPALIALQRQLEASRSRTAQQSQLLREIAALDEFLGSIPRATSIERIKEQLPMLTEAYGLHTFSITSGPGDACRCCGRPL
jgi:hypothetical protein